MKPSTNARIRLRLPKLIGKHPKGIWAANVLYICKEEYSLDLDFHDSGFDSITVFVSNMPNPLTIIAPDETKRFMILDARVP